MSGGASTGGHGPRNDGWRTGNVPADYYQHTRCGHHSTGGVWGTGRVTPIDDLCGDCRAARIGEVIDFVRFGTVPTSGRSHNHRDRTAEEGVSVYEVRDGRADLVGWHFDFLSRPAYTGR